MIKKTTAIAAMMLLAMAFVAGKSIDLVVHKDAVPAAIKAKLGIK